MEQAKKVAVVTGGSRGIGRGICVKLAEEGMDIVINYGSNHAAAEETRLLCEAQGAKVLLTPGDISCLAFCQELFARTIENFGSVDVLVDNAGITKDRLAIQMKEDDFCSVLDINLNGTFFCMQQAAKIMIKKRSGCIISIGSVAGQMAPVGQINYAASKAGIAAMSKVLAKELAPRGIRVNVVAPGFIETDMTDMLADKTKEEILAAIPLAAYGRTEDVAEAVAFLASEKARYITGHVLQVDGGLGM